MERFTHGPEMWLFPFMLSSPNASECNVSHQWFVASAVHQAKPNSQHRERYYEHGTFDGATESQLSSHGDLENNETNNDSVHNDDPAPSSRVLLVVHCIKKLVLVYKMANYEISQTRQKNHPRIAKNTVHDTDQKYEQSLRQEEAIAENRRLLQLFMIYSELS